MARLREELRQIDAAIAAVESELYELRVARELVEKAAAGGLRVYRQVASLLIEVSAEEALAYIAEREETLRARLEGLRRRRRELETELRRVLGPTP